MIQTPKASQRFYPKPSLITLVLFLFLMVVAGLSTVAGCSNPEPEKPAATTTEAPRTAAEAPPKAPARPALPSEPEPVTTVSPVKPAKEETENTAEPISEEERAAVSATAQKALAEAQDAGAPVLAPQPFAQGKAALAKARALLEKRKLEEARTQYEEAENLFVEARRTAEKAATKAEKVLTERSRVAVKQAPPSPREENTAAKTEITGDMPPEPPATNAPSSSPLVVMAEPTETVSEIPPRPETGKTRETEGSPPSETSRAPESVLLQAKQRAEAIRDKATTKRVLQVAQTTLEAASKHMADATQQETSAPEDAIASYELAAQLYGEALQKAETITQADEAAAKAREKALDVRRQITEEVRTLAQTEVVAGDTAWKAAEDAGDAPEQARALYDLAADEYAKALRVAAERAAEPEETSAKVQENLAAAQDRAQKAQGQITDQIRQYAPQPVAEADALWDLATQTAEHDPAKATDLFEQARGKYEDAAAAARSAKRQEFVTKLRERGVVVSSDATGDYATIGEAIDAVPPDTPIFIEPGVYKEAVVIDKPVALIGDGPVSEIRIESTNADCITIKTPQAVVHGLTLRSSSGFDNKGVYTIYCAEGRLLVEYCDIATDSLSAVAVTGAKTVPTFRGCNIHDSTQAGIFFYNGARGTVENCEIAGNGLAGIQIKSGANPNIRQCKIRQSKGSGIFANENGVGAIESCDISENALAGVSIATGGNPTVRDCTIANNRRYGVRVYESGRGTIADCTLSGNEPENWFIGEDCEVTRLDNKE